MLKLFAFYLDSCIVSKGEKFVHDLGTREHLEGVPIGSGSFEKFGAGPLSWGDQMFGTRSNRPVQAV
jgi:hypothetical protein